ncbi:hypothetical protein D5086_010511 [Populus alba]|uniref:Uncharacterized protein n=1 Tax=Populus alba TaxID=43335 RepID=A0ACC4CB25_POPAL
MSFGAEMSPLLGTPGSALSEKLLLGPSRRGLVPVADFVFYQFAFAAITAMLLAVTLLPVGASTIWGDGFLERRIIDCAGGYVIHLSSRVAGFTAAYWVIHMHS